MGPKVDDVREIVNELRGRGLDAGLRDVTFAIMNKMFGDQAFAFRCAFGDPPYKAEPEEYFKCEKVKSVREALEKFFPSGEEEQQLVTFDELKKGLIDDMNALILLRDQQTDDGKSTLEPKEMAQVVARIADIRVKLTEKFNTTQRVLEQRVVVENKYNGICPYCRHEISVDPSLFGKK